MSSPTLSSRAPRLAAALPYLALLGAIVSLSAWTSFATTQYPMVGPAATAALGGGLQAVLQVAVRRPLRARSTRTDLKALAVYGVVMGFMNLTFYVWLNTSHRGVDVGIEFTGPLAVALFNNRGHI